MNSHITHDILHVLHFIVVSCCGTVVLTKILSRRFVLCMHVVNERCNLCFDVFNVALVGLITNIGSPSSCLLVGCLEGAATKVLLMV